MPFQLGRERTGGRKPGTPNRVTQDLLEKAEELGVDPFEILLRFAKGDWEGLGYESRTHEIFNKMGDVIEVDVIEPEMRLKAASEACVYLHPKRKAIEVKDDRQSPLETYLLMTSEERQTKLADIQKRLAPVLQKE